LKQKDEREKGIPQERSLSLEIRKGQLKYTGREGVGYRIV
jgi:hypothetical protein